MICQNRSWDKLVGLYLEAKALSSEVTTLMVDQTKLQLQGKVSIGRHLYLQQENVWRHNKGKERGEKPWKERVSIGLGRIILESSFLFFKGRGK